MCPEMEVRTRVTKECPGLTTYDSVDSVLSQERRFPFKEIYTVTLSSRPVTYIYIKEEVVSGRHNPPLKKTLSPEVRSFNSQSLLWRCLPVNFGRERGESPGHLVTPSDTSRYYPNSL